MIQTSVAGSDRLKVGASKFILSCGLKIVLFLTFSFTATAQGKSVKLKPLDQRRIQEIASYLQEQPAGFGEPAANRKHWQSLLKSGHYDTFLKGMKSFIFPEFSKADYFSLSDGTASSSAPGLNMMRNRAGGLSKVTIAECLENQGRYMKDIENGLKDIILQKSWVSPRVDYDFINYNGKQYTIDLTSALYAHTIAQTLYLLGDKINPELRKEAVGTLYSRVFDPLMKIFKEQSTQYHSWLVGTNNWNAVCLSGVIGAALTVIPDKNERAVYAYIGEEYSRNTLAGFGDDGYCSEGVTYFNYGFGHYAMLRENLWLASNGKIDLFKIPKVKAIAMYIPKLEVINGVFPAISDSKTGSRPDSSLMCYLNRTLNLGLEAYQDVRLEGRVANNRMDVMMVFPEIGSQAVAAGQSSVGQKQEIRSFFDQSGILVTRPGDKSKAKIAAVVKGGHNREHHNHNDVGSYTVVSGSEIMAGDPGSIPYTANIFQEDFRYTYKSIASYGHPVPVVAGQQQVAGREAKASVTDHQFSDGRDVISMDLISCYNVPSLRKLTRKFTYDRAGTGSLSVDDEFGFSEPELFETAWITRAEIKELSKGKWLLSLNGRESELALETSGLPYTVLTEEISEGGVPYTRIGIRLEGKHKTGSIRLVYHGK